MDMRQLLGSWFLSAKWQYYFLLLSDTGALLAREKYSAFAIDRIYADEPSGRGWLGQRLDRYLLDLPVHRAVRDRLAFVTRRLTGAVQEMLARDLGPVTVLSVPCGLGRDLGIVHGRLRDLDAGTARRLRLYGVDLDYEGRILDEARRRAQAAGVPVRLVQASILAEATWAWLRAEAGPLAAVNCIGLTPWLVPDELRALLATFALHLRPGGCVLLDRFNRGKHSNLGAAAEIHAHYHSDEVFRDAITASGLAVEACETFHGGEGVGYVLRAGHLTDAQQSVMVGSDDEGPEPAGG
jgi:SAM-dependent methyltransferase